jgi:hypothetical protein
MHRTLSKNGMTTSHQNYDPINDYILSKGVRIESLVIHGDRLLFFLNTNQIMMDSISNYPRLQKCTNDELNQFRLISSGMGVHWPTVDEDLSLYGLLKDYFIRNIQEQKELVIS